MAKYKGIKFQKPWPCQRCGKCCVVLPMAPDLIINNRNKFQRKVIEEHPFETSPGHYMLSIITDDMNCVFLTKNNLCAIYEDRPEICRKFGHSIGVLECHRVSPSGRIRTPKESKKAYERIQKLERETETKADSIARGYELVNDDE